MKSIIQTEKECYFCKTTQSLELHHIFFGVANRRLSDSDGLVCFLCAPHHRGIIGVHSNREKDLELKRIAEKAYLSYYNKTTDDFIKKYGKNYL